jgi:hypothetical protein
MTKFILLAAVATLSLSAVSAEARDRWRHNNRWENQPVYLDDEDQADVAYYEEDDFVDDEDVVIPLRRRDRAQQMRDAEQQVDDRLWWLDDNARTKLEKRHPARKQVIKKNIAKVEPAAKPKAKVVVVVKPKAVKSVDVQTASLTKAPEIVKPKAKAAVDKTIGCTAGAAVVTGYGFAEVKPKACTGKTYAYTAARAGKVYEIKLTAASGEITDVKKLQ